MSKLYVASVAFGVVSLISWLIRIHYEYITIFSVLELLFFLISTIVGLVWYFKEKDNMYSPSGCIPLMITSPIASALVIWNDQKNLNPFLKFLKCILYILGWLVIGGYIAFVLSSGSIVEVWLNLIDYYWVFIIPFVLISVLIFGYE